MKITIIIIIIIIITKYKGSQLILKSFQHYFRAIKNTLLLKRVELEQKAKR
jgi:hypothetical protein